jgi:hypothetical protein
MELCGIGLSFKLGTAIFQNIDGDFCMSWKYTFQHDNISAHSARVTRDFLQQTNIEVMPWSALSPDVNPIDHARNEISR